MSTLAVINDFLSKKRLAIVGVSRDPKDFSRALFREFLKQGYDAVPINPRAEEVEGRRCLARIADVSPSVETALLMTPPEVTGTIVAECADAGLKQVWMHRATGQGAVNPEAVALCREKGIEVIEGYCPFMFLPRAAFCHRAHAFLMKLVGSYPH